MTDLFLITYTDKTRHNVTFQDEVPTTEAEAVDVITENLLSYDDITAVRAIHLVADTGRWHDATEDLLNDIRVSAFCDDSRKLLEHPVIHPQGFCFDCYTNGGRCMGCKVDAAA